MKIAFVHDWLVFPWWAEKVFFDIIKYTQNKKNINHLPNQWKEFIKDMEELGIYKQENEYKIFTTFHKSDFPNPTNLQIEAALSSDNIWKYFRNLMPFFPIFSSILSKKINKYNPDVVIISSFAIWKNLNVKAKKVLYLHSVMQYIRSHYEDYVKKFSWIKKLLYILSSKYLRIWDKKHKDFDKIYFNSNYTKETFNKTYNKHLEWKILFPLVEKPNFKEIDLKKTFNIEWEYYIYIWRLVRLVKNLDIIIDVFNKTGKQLIIVGDGPDKDYLKSLVKNKNIKFLWYLDSKSDEYWSLLKNAKALINITKESFWIVNYQAYLAWTKLISINKWAINDIPWEKILIEKYKDLEKVI